MTTSTSPSPSLQPGTGAPPGRVPSRSGVGPDAFDPAWLVEAAQRIRETAHVVAGIDGRLGVVFDAEAGHSLPSTARPAWPLVASLAPLFPERLGDRSFQETHGCRFPYVAGEMANGIATTAMVVAAVRAGFAAFFGAAGLAPARVEEALLALHRELGPGAPGWGINLIHSPTEHGVEEATVDLLLRHDVRRVSASAFMELAPSVVRYAATGLRRDVHGRVRRRNHVVAKVSRAEVARAFLSPAPAAMLDALAASGRLAPEEAALARTIPVAGDLTVEADSGGHTDNRPLSVIFPVIAALRDELSRHHAYDRPVRVGAAGGIGTPSAVAAAFALGASYVLTGSVNQCAVEAGLAPAAKRMLAAAGPTDVMMAPAADMFEMGVRVQVLSRGTMFGPRARGLYEAWLAYPSIEDLPGAERARLEREVFQMSLDEVWDETRRFWTERDPAQVERAEQEPRHRMALCFRWYLGQASRWAIAGEPSRVLDYQIWCGPAIGSFNDWVRGSFLDDPAHRTVEQVGLNLLEGAAAVTRAQQFRACGVAVPTAAFHFVPRRCA